MRKTILWAMGIVAMMIPSGKVLAQCDCDFIISLSATEWQFDGAKHGVKPGDKICFASGTRTGIAINNVKGTATNPVIITNMCDGKVVIDAPASYGNAVEINGCSNIRFTGSGNPNEQYGIEIKGGQMGINFQGLSTDFEVDHLNVNSVGCVGIVAKTDPTCDPSTWRANFTMRNTFFHHNTISNTGCEGMYIGNSHYEMTLSQICTGVLTSILEHKVDNCQVYENTLKNIGNDGIQIGGTTNCVVHDNYLNNIATNRNYGHQNGFQAGGGTQAVVYNNIVDTGTGYGYYDSGGGGTYYNNIGINCAGGAMMLQDAAGTWASKGFVVTNNNFINCPGIGIMMFSENPATSYFTNNIFVAPASGTYTYIKLNNAGAIKYVDSNNIKTQDISSVKFTNASGKDYHILTGSPAIDKGMDMRSYGVTVDIDGVGRPQGSAVDIGAYEFKSSTNSAPKANAGVDKSITLPTTQTTFSGSGTDSDGTISSYAWTKVSGGNATLTNANTANLTVSGLVAGTYTFRLTVTDNKGATATDDVVLTVLTVNVAPVANAGADKSITLPITQATFSGSGTDSDGTIASYSWIKASGGSATLTNANTTNLTVTGLVAGTYTFRLTVTDNKGATGTDDVVLTVLASNTLPVVSAGADKSITLPTNQATFNGSATDASGTITGYTWSKVSGGSCTLNNTTTANLTATGLAAGNYTFRLTVTDSKGAKGSDDVNLTVNQSASSAPIGKTISLKGANAKYVSSKGGVGAMWCNATEVQSWNKFLIVDAGGGKIALQNTGMYVSSATAGAITCNTATIGTNEKFDWVVNSDGSASLRGSNGWYISCEWGSIAMTCTRKSIDSWERFNYSIVTTTSSATSSAAKPAAIAPTGKTIWLLGSNNQYVSSKGGAGSMWCNATILQTWNQFVVADAGNGQVTLQNIGLYVSSEDGIISMTCNRKAADTWEKFDWIVNSNGTISLRGTNGLYVSSGNGATAMICNKTTIGVTEMFNYGVVSGTSTARTATTDAPAPPPVIQVEETSAEENERQTTVYPNPLKRGDMLTVTTEDHTDGIPLRVAVISLDGKVVANYTSDENTIDIPTSDLLNSLYVVKIMNGHKYYTRKIIIR